MDNSRVRRRRFIEAAVGSTVLLSGCAGFKVFEDPPNTDTSPNPATTTPSPENTLDPGSVSIRVIEDFPEDMEDFERESLYNPRAPVLFATDYWKGKIGTGSLDVKVVPRGESHDSADIVIHWATSSGIFDYEGEPYHSRDGIDVDDKRVAVRKPSNGTVENRVDIVVDARRTTEVIERGLRTALGAALGASYENGSVMDPRYQFYPAEGEEVLREFIDAKHEIFKMQKSVRAARKALVCSSPSVAQEAINAAHKQIGTTINAVEQYIPVLEEYPAPYGANRLKLAVQYFDVGYRSVVDFIQSQLDNGEAIYATDDSPSLVEHEQVLHETVDPAGAVEMGIYETWIGQDLDFPAVNESDLKTTNSGQEVEC